MIRRKAATAGLFALAALAFAAPASAAAPAFDSRVVERLTAIDRTTPWRLVASIPLRFPTFHPQGMVKIGGDFYLSSVEIRVSPKRVAEGRSDAGAGVGHLFKFDAAGALLADRLLGEGAAYHPGGIDYDGRSIWVPVSEYRPDSRAILYRVAPATMTATEAFRFDDHIGAVAFDRAQGELRGFSWGSRRSYRWRIRGLKAGMDAQDVGAPSLNPFHYIDYQDCHAVGPAQMLCSGLADYPGGAEAAALQLGGMELISLTDGRPLWQAPVPMRSASGRPMTQNPAFVEAAPAGLRAYFIPDDDRSVMYVYEVASGAGAGAPPQPSSPRERPAGAGR